MSHPALKLCNSYTRLPTLIGLYRGLAVEGDEWLRLLGDEWSVCDNITDHLDDLLDDTPLGDILLGGASGHALMTDDERAALAALPEEVTIYRGCYKDNKWGLSWSLERSTAERFPSLHRYSRQGVQPILVKAITNKSRIAALKLDRQEAEIITWRPKHISTSYIRGIGG